MITEVNDDVFHAFAHVIIAFPRADPNSVINSLYKYTRYQPPKFEGLKSGQRPLGTCEVKETVVTLYNDDAETKVKQIIMCYAYPGILTKTEIVATPGNPLIPQRTINEEFVEMLRHSFIAAERWMKSTGFPLKVAFPFTDPGVEGNWDVIFPVIEEVFQDRTVVVCKNRPSGLLPNRSSR